MDGNEFERSIVGSKGSESIRRPDILQSEVYHYLDCQWQCRRAVNCASVNALIPSMDDLMRLKHKTRLESSTGFTLAPLQLCYRRTSGWLRPTDH